MPKLIPIIQIQMEKKDKVGSKYVCSFGLQPLIGMTLVSIMCTWLTQSKKRDTIKS